MHENNYIGFSNDIDHNDLINKKLFYIKGYTSLSDIGVNSGNFQCQMWNCFGWEGEKVTACDH